jgi:hypothetical protein
MAIVLPIPPTGQPYLDPVTGQVNVVWQRYFLSLQNGLQSSAAPNDAKYWVSTSNASLLDETNLGVLPTGYLKITTAIGVATPSTTTTIPSGDITGGQALTKTNDTNVTLTLTGTPASSLLKATNIAAGWTGLLGLSRGGTNTNLSLTGGPNQVLKQTTSGGPISVGQLATTDISGIVVGTYTPVLYNTTNVAASTAYVCQYCQIGTFVMVSGRVAIDPTAAAATLLGMSLPVASVFTQASEAGGTGVSPGVASQCAAIYADATQHRALMGFVATNTTNQNWSFSYGYRIV